MRPRPDDLICIRRADEQPELEDDPEYLWNAEGDLKGCKFCGQSGHRFANCPHRLKPYKTPGGKTRYR